MLRSPHVNKKAREQFQLSAHKRLMDIYSSSSKTVDALMKLELPSGVDVEIKSVINAYFAMIIQSVPFQGRIFYNYDF